MLLTDLITVDDLYDAVKMAGTTDNERLDRLKSLILFLENRVFPNIPRDMTMSESWVLLIALLDQAIELSTTRR